MTPVVYRISDRIPVRIGDVTFWLAPLSYGQRGRIDAAGENIAGATIEQKVATAALALKMSIKGIDGVKTTDGEPYVLEFDESTGELTEDCTSEIMGLDGVEKLVRLAITWGKNGIFDPKSAQAKYEESLRTAHAEKKITDEQLQSGLRMFHLEGVVVDFTAVRSIKKKSSALN